MLVKEGGYSLGDINGSESVVYKRRRPTAAETLRGALPERLERAAALFVLALGAAASVSASAALAALGVALVLAVVAVAKADETPRVEREKLSSPGMSEAEVWRRMVALDELTQMRNEKAEDEIPDPPKPASGPSRPSDY